MQILPQLHLFTIKPTIMKKLALFFIACCFSTSLLAYPISPRPLRKLVIESENIVWAYVADLGTVKQTKKKDYDWDKDYATLIIKERLQGNLSADTIKVFFRSGLICPAPGVFFKGETVLAFLDKHEKGEGYNVHALSYGVKHGLTEQEFAIYKIRITEMQDLIKSGEATKCNDCILEWLVKCAEQKCTRWEGTYELSPQSDFMSYYDRDQHIQKDIFLSKLQRERLFSALMTVDSINYDDIGLIDIVKGMNDSMLLDFLKVRLPRVHQDYLWPAKDIMDRIVELTGSPELEKLAEEFNDVYFDYSEKGKNSCKKILSDFIGRMKTVELKKIASVTGPGNA